MAAFALLWAITGDLSRVQPDEAWFAHVLERLLKGEALYRDVFFGTTPLSILAALPFAAAFGPHLAIVRFLAASLFCFTGWIGLALLQPTGATEPVTRWVFVLAMCCYGRPSSLSPLYNPLCYLLLLVVLAVAVSAMRRPSTRTSLVAGLCAGLCFAAKQNVGGYVFAALLTTLAFLPTRVRQWAWALAGFAAASVTLLPFAPKAGASALWENMVGSKISYVQLVSVSYWEGVRGWFEFAAGIRSKSLAEASHLYWTTIFLLPMLAAAVLLHAWLDGKHKRSELIGISAFSVAAALGLFPLGDEAHTMLVTPIALIVILKYCPRPSRRSLRRCGAAALLLWLSVGPLYWLASSWRSYATGRASFCQIAGLRGALVANEQTRYLERTDAMLMRAAPADGRILILSPYAGLHYATTGLKNPTAYDYPLTNVFTASAKNRLARAVSLGSICTVAVDRYAYQNPFFAQLRPIWLEDAVRAKLSCSEASGNWLICGSPARGI